MVRTATQQERTRRARKPT